ncbi:MAG: coat protein [Fushun levivirus 6]|nr:MAG: coat protein [Fushun levivirus 6]
MPQLQNLVLKDREATPVSHTFVPRDIRDNVGTVVESSGVPIGESRVSVSLRKSNSNRYKATVKLVVPVVRDQTVNGLVTPAVVRTSYVNIEFDFDGASTTQERENVQGMVESAMAKAQVLIHDAVVGLQGVY